MTRRASNLSEPQITLALIMLASGRYYQYSIAERVGTTQQIISRIKRGKVDGYHIGARRTLSKLDPKILLAMADALERAWEESLLQ